MLFVEIQQGKTGMETTYPYNLIHGATAACTLRMAAATKCLGQAGQPLTRNLFYADSGFASVKTAEQIQEEWGHDFIGPVKTNTKNFPKKAIKDKMASWSSGPYIHSVGRHIVNNRWEVVGHWLQVQQPESTVFCG